MRRLRICQLRALLDGDLVLKDGEQPAWSTQTVNTPPGNVTMQGDGHLLLNAANGTIPWKSCTAGNNGARPVVENSGRLAIYSSSGALLWDHVTNQTGAPNCQ